MEDDNENITNNDSINLSDDISTVKRGRGRPKGSGKKSDYTKIQKLSHDLSDNTNLLHIDSLSSNNILNESVDSITGVQRRSQSGSLTPRNVDLNSNENDKDNSFTTTTTAVANNNNINNKPNSCNSSRSRSRSNKSDNKERNSNIQDRDEYINNLNYPSHNLYHSLSSALPSSSSTRSKISVSVPPPPPHNCETYESGQLANIKVIESMMNTVESGLKKKEPLLLGPTDRAMLTMFREWASHTDLQVTLELLKKQRDSVLARFDEIDQDEGMKAEE